MKQFERSPSLKHLGPFRKEKVNFKNIIKKSLLLLLFFVGLEEHINQAFL